MSTNKNAVIRYKYIDELLSKNRGYTRREIFEKCNEQLRLDGYSPVNKRTIEGDIVDLSQAPFSMEIEELEGRKLRYQDPTRCLFARQFSKEEKQLLREVINVLGQVSGLESFSWIDDLQRKLNDKGPLAPMMRQQPTQDPKVISFSTNEDYAGLEHLKPLFSHIVNKHVVEVTYSPFDKPEMQFRLFPYQLKQYNDRWYLLGTPVGNEEHPYDPSQVWNLALDRIQKVEQVGGIDFIPCQEDLEERYEEIIGVTLKSTPVTEILLAVDSSYVPYLDTKPLHGSQVKCRAEKQQELHAKYPQFDAHTFYRIEVRPNRELFNHLLSRGKDIALVEPADLRQQMVDELTQSLEKLKSLSCEN